MNEPKPKKDEKETTPADAEESGDLSAEDLDDVAGGVINLGQRAVTGGQVVPTLIDDDDDPLIP